MSSNFEQNVDPSNIDSILDASPQEVANALAVSGLSVSRVSMLTGVARNTITKFLNGEPIRDATRGKIVSQLLALGVFGHGKTAASDGGGAVVKFSEHHSEMSRADQFLRDAILSVRNSTVLMGQLVELARRNRDAFVGSDYEDLLYECRRFGVEKDEFDRLINK